MCRLFFALVLLASVVLAAVDAWSQDNYPESGKTAQQSKNGDWFAERIGQLARNRPDDALTLSEQALAYFADNPAPQAHGQVLNASAYALYFLGRYGESMQYTRKAELLAEQHQLKAVQARALMLQGNVLQSISEYPRAISKYQQAATYYRESGDRLYEGYCYNNMANTYERAGQYQTAFDYYQQYTRLAAGKDNLASAEKGFGSILLQLGNPDKAIRHFNKALSLYTLDSDNLGIAITHNSLGKALLSKGELTQAFKHLDHAIGLASQHNLQHALLSSLQFKSEALLKQGDLEKAMELLIQALETAQNTGSLETLSEIEYKQADIYQRQGKLQLAYQTLQSAQQTQEQYLSERSATQLSVMQALFDSETKAAQIKQLEQKNQLLQLEQEVSRQQTQNARLMAAMLFGALGLSTLWAVHIFRERQRLSRLAAKLKAARQQAEAAAEAKAAFLANMSHEIRTPINAVMGLSQLALDTGSVQEKKGHLHKILDAGNTLLRLVDDILDVSRIEAGKLHIDHIVMEPRRVVQSAINMNALQAHEKGLSLLTDIDSALPTKIIGDPGRIQQILVNLLSNGIKFTAQGQITLSVSKSHQAPDARPMLLFSVSDTGIGMSQEQQQRLFTSFSQGDDSITRQYGGTGLGLAICKQLSELMGGEIWVESEEGKGSTFRFTLPLQLPLDDSPSATGHEQAVTVATIAAPDFTGYSALLVDDNSINCEVARGLLNKTGILVDVATNGVQALEKLQQQPFDLILMDIQMPELDGLSATRRIREELNLTTPVIAITAHIMESERQQSLQAGMDDHLAKPIDPQALYRVLNTYLPAHPPVQTGSASFPTPLTASGPQQQSSDMPSAAWLDSLRELKTLDIDSALHRLGGNSALYTQLVQSFCRDQQHSANTIRRLLNDDDHRGLFRAVHSLKSSFAYIGAFELSQSSLELERKLELGQVDSEGLLNLCDKLASLLIELAPYAPTHTSPSVRLGRSELIQELEQILPLLEHSDLSAQERLSVLEPAIDDATLAAQIDQLRSYTQDIEFEQAAELARSILSYLQSPPSVPAPNTAAGRDEQE